MNAEYTGKEGGDASSTRSHASSSSASSSSSSSSKQNKGGAAAGGGGGGGVSAPGTVFATRLEAVQEFRRFLPILLRFS
jgi:hypothetical protein